MSRSYIQVVPFPHFVFSLFWYTRHTLRYRWWTNGQAGNRGIWKALVCYRAVIESTLTASQSVVCYGFVHRKVILYWDT